MTDFYQLANRAESTVATLMLVGDDHVHVAAGEGAFYPATGSFPITICLSTLVGDIWVESNIEICLCTSRATDTLTVTRAQEGTSALEHAVGELVQLRVTKGLMENLRADIGNPNDGEVHLTPKASSTGGEGTMFYDSDDNFVYVATE